MHCVSGDLLKRGNIVKNLLKFMSLMFFVVVGFTTNTYAMDKYLKTQMESLQSDLAEIDRLEAMMFQGVSLTDAEAEFFKLKQPLKPAMLRKIASLSAQLTAEYERLIAEYERNEAAGMYSEFKDGDHK
jgi:hypothetical protein